MQTKGPSPPASLLVQQTAQGDSGQVLMRSKVRAVSRRMGFGDIARENMELVCNEMLSNQVKFAQRSGLVQLWEVKQPSTALDLFALDYGPGIANLEEAMKDGYTTGGTMGKGLGAIERLAHESAVYSVPAGTVTEAPWHGVAVWARFYLEPPRVVPKLQIGTYTRAYQDARDNGDCICFRAEPARLRWVHMDGLGHGAQAAESLKDTRASVDMESGLEDVMHGLSGQLQGTRGAVAITGEVEVDKEQAVLCGVGDMSAVRVLNGERRQVVFSPGILGHAHRSFEQESLAFPPQALLMSLSDGIRRSWGLSSFPGLWRKHPQLIAMVLGTVMGRDSDDRSAFVIRTTPAARG